MADTQQFNVKLATATKALLTTYCQEKHATQGDVVDAALQAFLRPTDDDDMHQVMLQLLHGLTAKQEALEQGVAALVPLLTSIVEKLEAQQTPPTVPVASYGQMYQGFLETPPVASNQTEEAPASVVSQPDAPPHTLILGASQKGKSSWWSRRTAR